MTTRPILLELEPSCNRLYYLVLGLNSERIGGVVIESIDPSIRGHVGRTHSHIQNIAVFRANYDLTNTNNNSGSEPFLS